MYAKITFQKAKVYNTLIFVILVHIKQFHNARKLDNTKKIVIFFFWTKINELFYSVLFSSIYSNIKHELICICILVCGAFLKVKKNTVIEFNMELQYCVYIHGNTIAFFVFCICACFRALFSLFLIVLIYVTIYTSQLNS